MPPLLEKMVERQGIQDNVRNLLLAADAVQPGVLIASAIQGQSGIGKTILAQLLAYDPNVRRRFPDGIYWLPFGQEPNILSILTGLIETFDPNFKPTAVPAASGRVQAWYSDRACLLILDDVWQAAHIRPLLAASERSQFLVTTRRVSVADHMPARRFSLDVMTPEEAKRLFENRLDRSLNGNELTQALQLAETIGRLPLTLNLVVSRVANGEESWEELIEALGQEVYRLKVIQGADSWLNEQRGLEATLTLSLSWIELQCNGMRERYAWFGVLPEEAVIAAPMAATLWGMSPKDAADFLKLFWKDSLLLPAEGVSAGQREYPGYRLHDLFHDMARRLMVLRKPDGLGLTIAQAHEELLTHYLERHSAWAGWSHLADDGYIHERLCWHLEQAKRITAMVDLFHEETEGRNGWYEARERLGQTAGYIQDVFRAWTQVQRSDDDAVLRGKKIGMMATELRFVLIISTVNSLAANIPANLLSALVQFEIWKPITALAYIRQKPAGRQRADALIAIAPLLPPALLQTALEVARQIGNDYQRSRALTEIASILPMPQQREVLLLEAMGVARRIQNTDERSQMMSEIASALAQSGQPDQALKMARQLQDAYERSQMLSEIASVLTDPQQQQTLLSEALEVARQIQDLYQCSLALLKIASAQTDPQQQKVLLSEALEVARQIQDANRSSQMLAEIASALVQVGQPDQALAVARQIKSAAAHSQVMSEIAAALAQAGQWKKALEMARQIQGGLERSWGLSRIASVLNDPQQQAAVLSEALEVARQLQDPYQRSLALLKIASAQTDPQQQEAVLSLALPVARQLQDPYQCSLALSRIASALTDPQQRETLLSEALVVARQIRDVSTRSLALSRIASALVQVGQPDQALAVVRQIESAAAHSQAMSEIAAALAQAGQWDQALEMARQLQDPYQCSLALSKIASVLNDPQQQAAVLSEALEVARQLQDPYQRSLALLKIASAQTDPQQQEAVLSEALAVARQIQDANQSSPMLVEIASALVQIGQPDQAMTMARQIQDAYQRSLALSRITSVLNDPQQQAAVLSEALEVARQLQDPYQRSLALLKIASAQTDPQQQEAVLSEALAVARQIQDANQSSPMLVEIASALVQVGQLDQALAVARQIQDAYQRSLALSRITSVLTDPQQREVLLSEALEVARQLTDAYQRSLALSGIAANLRNLPPGRFFHLCKLLLRLAVSHRRQEVLPIISALTPALVEYSGADAVGEVVTAIRDVTRWWP